MAFFLNSLNVWEHILRFLHGHVSVGSSSLSPTSTAAKQIYLHVSSSSESMCRSCLPCAITNFTKLYIERFLDNWVPQGDFARPFLWQFSPSPSFKHSLFLFLPPQYRIFLSLFSFLCSPSASDSMQLMQIVSLLCSIHVLRPEWDLNKTHTHTHTYTHMLSLLRSFQIGRATWRERV